MRQTSFAAFGGLMCNNCSTLQGEITALRQQVQTSDEQIAQWQDWTRYCPECGEVVIGAGAVLKPGEGALVAQIHGRTWHAGCAVERDARTAMQQRAEAAEADWQASESTAQALREALEKVREAASLWLDYIHGRNGFTDGSRVGEAVAAAELIVAALTPPASTREET